ncbi:ubiquinone biosynthesis protein UbiB [Ramlibacter ginsenosidimutans]|uniref:Ubiquinone biosynthesis protein UbiB n=1 Tax=Ramlibacter ginsenosidimutans TaxID=502333 RepID=A0A934TRE6_9BURK|nr:AarF/UbiB family protein [Ramlibacter ginsenosidimutans]MBK6005332.1 ubiquinone biosynthesis protein UbiB [Ramlibacter ginsenosidimutans]
MLWQALASVRDFARLYEIASVLVRYGFGDMVRRLGLADLLERAGRALHWDDADEYAHLSPPARVRRALEELGPTFVKLGQVLATRVDLFEPEWIAEFSRLQDEARPVPWDAMRAQLEEDLGGAPEEVFAEFDHEPVAAASLAQVYRARLPDGRAVVVKVRRPGIRPVIEADLRLLLRLADLLENESPALRALQPRQIVREFTQSLQRELDFATEARNAKRMARNFAGYTDDDAPRPADLPPAGAASLPVIVIPEMVWECERACVQEQIEGIPGSKLAQVDAAGLDRALLARRGARAVLKMILHDGFFHADPHPGNVFYLPGNRIAFIDFGMVGRLTEQRREQLLSLLLGLVKQQPTAVADVLTEWAGDGVVDMDHLLGEVEVFADQYRGIPLGQLRLGAMLDEGIGILRQHHLRLPADLSLLVKAFITLEGMGRELDPAFEMAAQALPILERAMRERYAPRRVLERSWRSLAAMTSLLSGLPQDLSRLLRAARRGRLEVHIEVLHLKEFGNQLDRAASRLVIGIVVAALIVGSSIVMTVPGGPSLLGLPVFGLLGFVGAVAGSVWLMFSMGSRKRSGRDFED